MEYTIVIALRDTEVGREFMMVHHNERGWELPGGKLEPKEGPVRCALREFREETGHLIEDLRFVLRLDKSNGRCHVFAGSLGDQVSEAIEDDAIEGFQWFERLPNDDLAFPDDPYDAMGEALGIRFR